MTNVSAQNSIEWGLIVRDYSSLMSGEYGTDFGGIEDPGSADSSVYDVSTEKGRSDLGFDRMARLIGVAMKRPFAASQEVDSGSKTGAKRWWNADQQKSNSSWKSGGEPVETLRLLYSGERIDSADDAFKQINDTQELDGMFKKLYDEVADVICSIDRGDLAFVLAGVGAIGGATESALAASVQAGVAQLVALAPALAGWPAYVLGGVVLLLMLYGIRKFCGWHKQGKQIME